MESQRLASGEPVLMNLTAMKLQRMLAEHVGRAQARREELGLPDPEKDPEEPFPSVIGDEWRRAGFPRAARERYVGRLPRDTGNPTDMARHFDRWPESVRGALLEASAREDAPILLNGPARSGKTSCAAWLGLRDAVWTVWDLTNDPPKRLVPGYFQLYVRAWDLLEKLKSKFSSEGGDHMATVARRAHFAVFDDIEEAGTPWERKTLTSIILDRIQNHMRTVVCLNQDAGEFEEQWGGTLIGALRRNGLAVNVDGASARIRGRSEAYAL